jgi:hypothetical protein
MVLESLDALFGMGIPLPAEAVAMHLEAMEGVFSRWAGVGRGWGVRLRPPGAGANAKMLTWCCRLAFLGARPRFASHGGVVRVCSPRPRWAA